MVVVGLVVVGLVGLAGLAGLAAVLVVVGGLAASSLELFLEFVSSFWFGVGALF